MRRSMAPFSGSYGGVPTPLQATMKRAADSRVSLKKKIFKLIRLTLVRIALPINSKMNSTKAII